MSYSEHELLDRTNMVVEILEAHLLGHSLMNKPTRHDHLEIFTHLVDASTHLAKAY